MLAFAAALAVRRAQRVGPHHDALAVRGQDQHVVLGRLGVLGGGVEVLDVDRGAGGEFLDLAFADLLAGGAADGRAGLLERAAGGFDRGQPAQPVGVPLDRQVQRRVGGVQVLVPAVAVGQAFHLDLAEDAGQRPAVTGLDRGVHDCGVVGDRGQPRLVGGAQGQVLLQHAPQQLPAAAGEFVLQFGVGQARRLAAFQPGQQLFEASAGVGAEAAWLGGPGVHRPVRPRAARLPRSWAMPSAACASRSALARS